MFSTLISLSAAWNVLIFFHEIDAVPSFTDEPSNPSRVNEGDNITLRWTYNIDGTFRDSTFVLVRTGATIALKDSNGLAVAAEFADHVQVIISDGEAALTLLHVNRSDRGDYRYSIRNTALRSAESVVNVFVQFKAENVQLSTNATGNQACLGSYLNFTCSVGTHGNPEVYYYQLFRNDTVLGTSSSGEWIRMLSSNGVFTYKCQANNTVGAANSTTVTVTVGEASTIQPLLNETTTEGQKLNLFCNSSGTPPPVVSWVRISTGQRFDGHVLALTNINRSEAGDYRCESSNDCGNDSKTTTIHVKFKPENVQLLTNITANNTCPGGYWNFTCSVGAANPQVTSYQLLENDIAVDTSSLGMWIKTLSNSGVFTYKCLANNTVGSTISANDKNITVAEPASVVRIVNSSDTLIEGNSFNVFCNASGDPKLDVFWIKEDTDRRINGSVLNFTSINRNDSGTYRCEAKNDCGSDSRVEIISVSYPPNITYISANMTVNQSDSVNLTYRADGNPKPAITWSKDGKIVNSSFTVSGKSDEGLYVCNASNGIGNASIKSVFITVEYFGPFNTALTKSVNTVRLNTTFNLNCSAQANPPASYRIYRGQESLGSISVGNTFETYVVERTSQVKYSCTPFNHFGDGQTVMIQVEVYYSPQVTESNKIFPVSQGNRTALKCPVDGNPPPSVQWYKGNGTSGKPFRTGETLEFSNVTSNDGGVYTCLANNTVATVTATVFLQVEPPKPLAVTTATEESTSTPSKSSDKGVPRWFIIGGAIGAAVLVIIIIVVAWWVHKKRKCRKDTKIHNSESQVLHGENDIEDGVHAKVNGGYADAGPQSANGTNLFVQPPPEQQQQQAAAAPPAYAVVDKSKKKKKDKKNGSENIPDYAVVDKSKKKKKKAEVEDPYAEVEDPRQDKKTADPATHDYAIVDKSKKKKKEADENAYATVDKSKKSKKQKPKAPGEVLYADLDDFKPVQAPSMPTVSTSPEPLAPLKRPTPYQGTEYADITQFLKGNATLPEGQSTEMQPTYANAGGGQEAANKENANTGGEGGGGDTEPKETPM